MCSSGALLTSTVCDVAREEANHSRTWLTINPRTSKGMDCSVSALTMDTLPRRISAGYRLSWVAVRPSSCSRTPISTPVSACDRTLHSIRLLLGHGVLVNLAYPATTVPLCLIPCVNLQLLKARWPPSSVTRARHAFAPTPSSFTTRRVMLLRRCYRFAEQSILTFHMYGVAGAQDRRICHGLQVACPAISSHNRHQYPNPHHAPSLLQVYDAFVEKLTAKVSWTSRG